MARRIEHRSTSEWPASEVGRALIDPEYLRDRLDELGGSDPELIRHKPTADGASFLIRQGVRAELLPTIARNAVGGDLRIERSESWRRAEDGHYTGEIAAEIAGVPCSITGSMWLRDLPAANGSNGPGQVSEFVTEATVQVNIPLLGAKLEEMVADQVTKLLAAEERFTTNWLSSRK